MTAPRDARRGRGPARASAARRTGGGDRPRARARARAYPQVEPGAAGICDVSVVAVGASVRVTEALRRARQRGAGVVAAGRAWVLRDDLARASLLGLDRLPARLLARPLPVVDARRPEVAVRRLLAAGEPAVIVGDGSRLVGAVAASPPATVTTLGRRFGDQLGPAARDVVAAVAAAAAARGMRAFLVGGVVRDALGGLGAERHDLDVVVEGDGVAVARAVAGARGLPPRAVREHERFGTASVAFPQLTLDVVTARAERYEFPGALPRVVPATMGQDLARRDFTVNAMAVELASQDFGLLDPFGGREDVRRRRLRVLHPLSFVEDPTRIFRAARYAARLGFQVDRWTARAQSLALALGPYPALSGQRLAAELALIVRDAAPEVALRRLGTGGALRLLDARYRFSPSTAAQVGRLPAALAWVAARHLRVAPLEVALVALLGAQPPDVAQGVARRLALSGAPLARLKRALATPAPPPPSGPPSVRARALRGVDDLGLVAWWLGGGDDGRATADWFLAARAVRPALHGDDLVALGVAAGPDVARVLEQLRDGRLDGAITDRDGEATHVRDWIEQRKEG
jgi:tRNA nucleotidyltransferase (CCA-adding enzyme)